MGQLGKWSQIINVMWFFLYRLLLLFDWLLMEIFLLLFFRKNLLLGWVYIGETFMQLHKFAFNLFHEGLMIIVKLCLSLLQILVVRQGTEVKISSWETLGIYCPFLQMVLPIDLFYCRIQLMKFSLHFILLGDQGLQLALHLLKVNQIIINPPSEQNLQQRNKETADQIFFVLQLQNQLNLSLTMTMTPPPQPQPTNNVIFEEEDFAKLEQAERKVLTAPFKVTGIFATIYLIAQYGNLGKILPNPLAKKAEESKFGQFFRNKSKLVFVHSMLFLGISAFLGAYFAKQINKFKIFSKYRREVTYYMRWKIQNEIRSQHSLDK